MSRLVPALAAPCISRRVGGKLDIELLRFIPKAKPMTPQMLRAFEFVRDRLAEKGVSPSYQEMATHLNIASKSGVSRLVQSLVDRGRLEHDPGGKRGLRIPGAPDTGPPSPRGRHGRACAGRLRASRNGPDRRVRLAPLSGAPVMTGLIIDNFAGGGGASTGIEQALGRAIDVAINHDGEALAMHQQNHPGTHHVRNNIWQIDPREVTGGRPVQLAWFSPDCKHHSKAKGGKPREKSIRDLAWVVVLWAQKVKPDCIMLENVEEFRTWGPLDEEGQPIKARAGETFTKWTNALRRAGYRVQFKELRACDYGAPTTRKRLFLIARGDGKPIRWPKATHGKPGTPDVLRGKLQSYRTAADIIDWSIPCPSIFERARPLKENTLRRIAHGIMRFVVNNPKPFIVPTCHTKGGSSFHPGDEPVRTITTAKGGELAVVQPFLAPLTHHGSADRSYSTEAPTPTVTGAHRGEMAVIVPHVTKFRGGAIGHAADEPLHTVTANSFIKRPGGSTPLGVVAATVSPVIVGCGGRRAQSNPVGPEQPFPTITAKNDACIVAATIERQFGNSAGGAVDVPLPTTTAGGGGKSALVTATMAPLQHGERRPGETPREQAIDAPLSTIATGGKHAVVTATMVQTGYGERDGQAPRALEVEAPLGTVVAGGAKHAAVTALVTKFSENSRGHSPDEPLHTVMAGAPRHGVVCAHIEQANGGPNNRSLAGRKADEPLSTVTVKGSQQRLICAHVAQHNGGKIGREADAPISTITEAGRQQQIVTSNLVKLRGTCRDGQPVDEPAPTITGGGTHIAEVRAFLLKYYGSDQDPQLADPLHTVTTKDRHALVIVTIEGEEYVITDIGMRMLSPRELFNAQGFPPTYIIEFDHAGKRMTKTAQIRMCGNSVCPPMSRALVAANFDEPVELEKRIAA